MSEPRWIIEGRDKHLAGFVIRNGALTSTVPVRLTVTIYVTAEEGTP